MNNNTIRKQNRIMLTAAASGSGKTTITCALLYGLKIMGKRVGALKCGPDFIDPLFHRKVLGIETGNLDLFMSNEDLVKENLIYSCEKNDITVIEGAMGYFDGIGFSDKASAYDIAKKTKTPVILIIDGRGMARSIMAILDGFLTHDKEKNIKGIIVNNTSKNIWEFIKVESNKRGITPIGWVPRLKTSGFASRHLGLITPNEIGDFNKIIADIFEEIKDNIDWDALNDIASGAENIDCIKYNRVEGFKEKSRRFILAETNDKSKITTTINHDLTIAIARDEAFCFYYDENIRILEEYGCKLIYFSPMHDTTVPEGIDALILWGGYPECFVEKLSENKTMLESVRAIVKSGMPAIAECGGYLYLQKTLEGKEMVGIFDGNAKKEDKLKHFGYIGVELKRGITLFGRKNICINAHEFHYCHIDNEENDFDIYKAPGTIKWTGGVATDNLYAAFPHIFFPGNIDFLESFLEKCIQSRTNVRKDLRFTR